MKATRILTGAACLALPVCLGLSNLGQAQESSIKRSASISQMVDPSQPGFDIKDVERSIRSAAKAMKLDAEQQASLDKALADLPNRAKPGAEKFEWKWSYGTNNDDAEPKAKPAQPRGRGAQESRPRAPFGGQQGLEEMMKELQESQGNGEGMGQMLEEMMKRMMGENFGQQQPNQPRGRQNGGGANPLQEMMEQFRKLQEGGGGKNFQFKFGPNGLEPQDGDEQNSEENEPRNQGGGFDFRRLMGMGAGADLDPDSVDRDSKYSRATLAEYRAVVREARKSTVNILSEGRPVALGAVVSADGHILTVASELRKGKLEIETMDGKIHPVELLDRDSDSAKLYGVALLQAKGANLSPLTMAEGELPVGAMLAAAGVDEDPISVGVLSVAERNLDQTRQPALGVSMGSMDDGTTPPPEKGVLVRQVLEDSPAEAAGLKANDVILAFNGEEVKTADDVINRVLACRVGQEVKLHVKSGEEEKDISMKLASRKGIASFKPEGPDQTARMGTNISRKDADFPHAMQNDLGVNANQCGGPVVNIQGQMVGLNVARSGRTATYMIGAKVVKDLISELNKGKLGLVLDKATLDQDIQSYEDELKSLQETLKAAEEKLKKAKEVKEKLK